MNVLKFALASTLLATSIGASFSAQAATTNHSGTICHAYNASESNRIDYVSSGVRNLATYSTQVVCPLMRTVNAAGGATVYVDIYHYGYRSTNCTLYSYSSRGSLLGSSSNSFSGSGFREISLSLSYSKTASWGDYALICSIPSSGNGVINGVDLVE